MIKHIAKLKTHAKRHKYPIILTAICFAFFMSLFLKQKVYAVTPPTISIAYLNLQTPYSCSGIECAPLAMYSNLNIGSYSNVNLDYIYQTNSFTFHSSSASTTFSGEVLAFTDTMNNNNGGLCYSSYDSGKFLDITAEVLNPSDGSVLATSTTIRVGCSFVQNSFPGYTVISPSSVELFSKLGATAGTSTTYGFSGSFGTNITVGSSTSPLNYSTTLTGLTCGNTYTANSFASNSISSSMGIAYSFTPACTPPTVVTTSASVITDSSVTLSGAITAMGSRAPTEVGFQYGPTTAYGATSTTLGTFGTGSFVQSVSGLSCGTQYHFRAYASNSSYGYGSDMTFTTTPCLGASGNVTGYIWSSNVGWISLNCLEGSSSGTSVCSSSPYSVNVVPNSTTKTGLFSGYAWSPNVGWVSFNPSDVSSCGIGMASSTNPGAQAKIDFSTGTSTSGHVSGWARVLSATASTGWDGCMSLRGSNYGVTYVATSTSNNLAGPTSNPSYAWGGSTMGWVSFAYANVNFSAPTVSLSVSSPTLTSAGGTDSLSWTTANLSTTACTASSSLGDWYGPKASGGGSDLLTFAPNTTTSTITHTYSLGCTGITGLAATSTPVTITIAPGASSTTSSLVFLANNAGAATSTPLNISSGDSVTLTWQLQNINHGSCSGTSSGSFSGWNGTAKAPLSSGASIGTTPVTFSEIIPSGVITTNRTYTMTCMGSDSVSRSKTVYINVSATSNTPSIALTANGFSNTLSLPSSGQDVTLAWTTANLDAASCTASSSGGDWSGSVSSTGGTYDLGYIGNTSTTATVTKTYTINGCTSEGIAVAPVTVTVTVSPVGFPYLSFYATNGSNTGNNIVISPTASTTLAWTVQSVNPNSCKGTSSGNFTGWLTSGTTKSPSTAATGTALTYTESEGLLTTSRSYTMTCTGANGAVIFGTVNLNANNNNNLVNFTINNGVDIVPNQTNITLPASGGTANLVWTTTNLSSSSCTASSSAGDWTGSRSSSGGSNSLTIPANTGSFAITQTYTLSGCVDMTGATVPPQLVSVTISPSGYPFLSFFANGFGSTASIPSGTTADLAWTLQNISLNSCKGTSSGSFSGWNSTTKGPSPAVGSTPTTSYETVGLDGSITSTRAYTMMCGTLPAQTVTINISTPCTGTSCPTTSTSTSPSINATHRPPWMEI